MPEAQLEGFTESTFTHDGTSRPVFRAGNGPAVIVIHEVPGLHPEAIAFGRRVVDAGFTVYMPSLFGTPGKPFGWGYTLRSISQACVAREFVTMAFNRTHPITVGCASSPPTPTPSVEAPGSGPSGCASPAGSPSG